MSWPAKCGETQFLQTLFWYYSQREMAKQQQEGGLGAGNVTAGFLISNDRDNFARGARSKRNRPLVLDDPKTKGWLQADWLSWLDVVAQGVTAGSRFENTSLTGFRCIATSKTADEMFQQERGCLSAEEIRAIKNQGVFVDLYEASKLTNMRLSTWYRESESGEAVRIILTEEGERSGCLAQRCRRRREQSSQQFLAILRPRGKQLHLTCHPSLPTECVRLSQVLPLATTSQ